MGFAAAAVLQAKTAHARELIESAPPKFAAREWPRWYRAFSFFLEQDFEAAFKLFLETLGAKDELVAALTLYVLQAQLSAACKGLYAQNAAKIEAGKDALVMQCSRRRFERAVQSQRDDLHCVVVSSLIPQAEKHVWG